MTKTILLLSGPIAVGKTSVANELVSRGSFTRIGTGTYLSGLAGARANDTSRPSLQDLGDQLDEETDYRWVLDAVVRPALQTYAQATRLLLDSARKKRQVEHLRQAYGTRIFHGHLSAPEETLRQRYEERMAAGAEYTAGISYEKAIAHPNEIASRSLVHIADVIIDTGAQTAQAAAVQLLRHLAERTA